MQSSLDALHERARRLAPLYRLVIISRLLLALAFIPTGMVKVLGRRFTLLNTDTPIGAFFEAMYQTGAYWNFLGWGQVLSGLLIVIPATATLGAVMFFPIILNIVVLTWALHFQGTVYVTVAMLGANALLLAWDFDRWKPIVLPPRHRLPAMSFRALPMLERVGYVLGGCSAMVVLLATRGLAPVRLAEGMFVVAIASAIMIVAGWMRAARAAP